MSWPKGSVTPKIEYGSRGFQTNSRITGPWNTADRDVTVQCSEVYWDDVQVGRYGTVGGEVCLSEERQKSFVTVRSPRYSLDKKQVLVEKTVQVDIEECT